MSILPSNEPKHLHTLDEALEARWGFEIIKNPLHPRWCEAKYLPFIAKAYDMDISLFSEAGSRAVLERAIWSKQKVGTVGYMKTAFLGVEHNVELVEWFRTGRKPFTFRVKIILNDTAQLLDQANLALYRELIARTKNVRSEFESFIVDMTITAEVKVSSEPEPLRFRPFMNINELIINDDITLKGGWAYEVTAQTTIDESIALSEINTQGGYRWQVEV